MDVDDEVLKMTEPEKRKHVPHEDSVAHPTGKDEMNLLEFSFSSASSRVSKSDEELVFESIDKDPITGQAVTRQLSMTFSSKYGRPTIEDDEVYVGLQAITHQRRQAGHDSSRVEFTRYELLRTLGWPECGPNYSKVDRAINRLGGVWLVWDNAFYEREIKSWVDVKFHIIDESHLFTREKYDLARSLAHAKRPKSWIRWGEAFYKSLADGYLATFDMRTYRGLKGGVAKKLYRYSNKRLWKKKRYVMDLRRLAEEKLGFKQGQYLAELARMLQPTFEELRDVGFSVNLKCKGRTTKQVHIVKTKSKDSEDRKPGSELPRDGVAHELCERGISNATALVAQYSNNKIQEQIENFDDRNRHGENLNPGWLRRAIEDPKGFGFRKGFKSSIQLQKEAKAKLERDRKKSAEQVKKRKEQQEQKRKDRDSWNRFIEYRNRFTKSKQLQLEDDALKHCQVLTRDLVLKARQKGDVGMVHQILWDDHIIPNL